MQWVELDRVRRRAGKARAVVFFAAVIGFASGDVVPAQHTPTDSTQRDGFARSFADPPADARMMMRWWWFGPAVEKPELERELRAMQRAGLGGVEIQPVYPLAVDDPAKGIRNLPYLSPEFLDDVRFANTTARSLGLRVDVTLGSGWPYGGPATPLALSAGCLKVVALAVNGPSMALPNAAEGDTLLAAFVAMGTPAKWSADGAQQLLITPSASSVMVPSLPPLSGTPQATTLLLFYASHTRQQVKRPAVGAEGYVLDHFSRAAIDEHLRDVADKLEGSFGTEPPYSVFSDSLEVYGSDWTAELPAEFLRRRGYDLIPHLAELYGGGTAKAAAVRNDWGRTLAELVRENYLTPVNDWAVRNGTQFRSQTYGDPAVTLADEAVAALPEGEGPQWREFSYTRWASSASHLYGRTVTSAETFTWLHSPVFRATPLDMKVEADRMFLSGANQIVGHGWPYVPPTVTEPGWSLYAAAVFNAHNPWFAVMPEVARYMQRGSWLLRQGRPVEDVGILLPEDDAEASYTPGHVSITDAMKRWVTPELTSTILDAGYNLDYVDAATLERLGKVPYPILVLPPTRRMPLATAHLLARFVASGGHLIATGEVPSLAPGLASAIDSREVAGTVERIFAESNAVKARSLAELAETLHKVLTPDVQATVLPDPASAGNDRNAGLGVVHRVMKGSTASDLYFVVNSSSSELSTTLTFRARHTLLREFSLDTGKESSRQNGNGPVAVTLAPYESRVFVLTDASNGLDRQPAQQAIQRASSKRETGVDGTVALVAKSLPSLVGGWTIQFPGAPAAPLQHFVPWNTLAGRNFYSGEAIYRRSFVVDRGLVKGDDIVLDFGEGTPTTDARKPGAAGIRALLDPPVREAAVVLVNGRRAGSLWHPPYALSIGGLLRPGSNTLEVHVYNTAVNLLAGQPRPDYSALTARYGKRFDPQDMDQISSIPSGLLRQPTLRVSGTGAVGFRR